MGTSASRPIRPPATVRPGTAASAAAAVALRRQGLTIREVAAGLGVSKSYVHWLLTAVAGEDTVRLRGIACDRCGVAVRAVPGRDVHLCLACRGPNGHGYGQIRRQRARAAAAETQQEEAA